MGRRAKPAIATVERPPPSPDELREAQTVRQFFIILCGIFFLGAAGGVGGGGVQAAFSACYAVGALGGLAGFIAIGRGDRRWSRLVYLLALGVPFLTAVASAAHVIRKNQLDLIERNRRANANPQK